MTGLKGSGWTWGGQSGGFCISAGRGSNEGLPWDEDKGRAGDSGSVPKPGGWAGERLAFY